MTHPYIKADGNVEIQLELYSNFISRLRDTIDFLEDCQTIANDVNEDTIEVCTSSKFDEMKQFFEKLDVKEFLQYLHKRISDKKEFKLTHNVWTKGRIYYLLENWDGEPETSPNTHHECRFQKIEECYDNSISEWEKERHYHDFKEFPPRNEPDVIPEFNEEENLKAYLELEHKQDFGALSDEEILFKRYKELEEKIKSLEDEKINLTKPLKKKISALEKTIENARIAAGIADFEFEEVKEVEEDEDDWIPF